MSHNKVTSTSATNTSNATLLIALLVGLLVSPVTFADQGINNNSPDTSDTGQIQSGQPAKKSVTPPRTRNGKLRTKFA